jgi:hypothetical protein
LHPVSAKEEDMNAMEREAIKTLGDLRSYPREHRRLGRLDDRVQGWAVFRLHLLLAVVMMVLTSIVVLTVALPAPNPNIAAGFAVVAAAAAGGWGLGVLHWRHIMLPHLQVLVAAYAASEA